MQLPLGLSPQVTVTAFADFEQMSNQSFDSKVKNVVSTNTFTVQLEKSGTSTRRFHYILLPDNIIELDGSKGKIKAAIIKEITPKNFDDKTILATHKLAYILSQNGKQQLYCDPQEAEKLKSVDVIAIESGGRRFIYSLRDKRNESFGLHITKERYDDIKDTYLNAIRMYYDWKKLRAKPSVS